MSSLFDLSHLWNMLLVPYKCSSSCNIHSLIYTFSLKVQCGETLSTQTSACLSFCFSKQQRWRPRQTQRKITRHTPNIPSSLMAAIVCPVLTRNEFGPQYSPQFPTRRWLMARWLKHMRSSVPKMLGCQFCGWNITWSSAVSSRLSNT